MSEFCPVCGKQWTTGRTERAQGNTLIVKRLAN